MPRSGIVGDPRVYGYRTMAVHDRSTPPLPSSCPPVGVRVCSCVSTGRNAADGTSLGGPRPAESLRGRRRRIPEDSRGPTRRRKEGGRHHRGRTKPGPSGVHSSQPISCSPHLEVALLGRVSFPRFPTAIVFIFCWFSHGSASER